MNKKHLNLTIIILIFLSVVFMSIGYSAFNSELLISGEAALIPANSIYISNIELINIENATESFSPEISDSTTNIGVNIPNNNSTFTYEVTITNVTSNYYYLAGINEKINTSNVDYRIIDLYLYDEFAPNSEIKFHITYEASSIPLDTNFTLNLEYIFTPGEIYKDETLNGADPDLIDGLIPIVYNNDNAHWEKADVVNGRWYDYDIQQWANATSVTTSTRDYYINAKPGTEVKMEDMTSMMVWIPRYSYTVNDTYGNQGYNGNTVSILTPGAFDIKFGDTSMLDTGTANYSGDYPTEYYTSPAFCWGNSCDDPSTRSSAENVEIPGFWMAKFEASKTDNILYSKPNQTPMVMYSIKDTFNFVQGLMNGMNGYNNYGFVGYVDAHLIKNTEWGAMAYLSQSAYGKYGNTYYTGLNKEIYPNNCLNYTTGIGGESPLASSTTLTCTTNTYDTYYGMGASTTGNIYGVYDTVGGTFDRVMGTVLTSSGSFNPDKSGFTSLPESKYINVYPYGNYGVTTTPSIKGDALTDTLGFYSDRGVTSEYLINSWFYRGGSLWSNATYINGIFSYTTYSGVADPNHSSRYTITLY